MFPSIFKHIEHKVKPEPGRLHSLMYRITHPINRIRTHQLTHWKMCISWPLMWCPVSAWVIWGMVMIHFRGYWELQALPSTWSHGLLYIQGSLNIECILGRNEESIINILTRWPCDLCFFFSRESSCLPQATHGSCTIRSYEICLF